MRKSMMEKLRKISTMYYLRQIVACLLVYCMFFNPAIVLATSNPVQVAGDAITGVNGAGTDLTEVLMGDSSRAVINWDSLDTLSDQELHFLKDAGNFAVLNRVIDGGATQFNGSLFGVRGDIFIVNTRGIVFGPESFIQARTFVASGIDIGNDDFMQVIQPDDDQFYFHKYSSPYPYSYKTGNVTNEGTGGPERGINAEQVALIGRNVTNKGVIRTTVPGGAVIMAAGNEVYLSQFGSNVAVQVDMNYISGHVVDNGGSQGTGDGTISADSGKVILAAGDIWSTAIEGIESLRAEAKGDITLEGVIDASGHVEILGGQSGGFYGFGADADIQIKDDITAGSMRIKNGKDVDPGEQSHSGIYVADDKNLTATDGDVVVEAVHDIILGGNVSATGDVFLNADEDGYGDPRDPDPEAYNPRHYGGGDLIAKGTITAGGDVDILGNAIDLGGDVSANGGDLTITGRTSKEVGFDWVRVSRWRWERVPKTTLLNNSQWGEVQVGPYKTLLAAQDVYIIDGGGTEEPPAPDMMTLRGDESLAIVAGAGSGVDDGEIIVVNTTIVVEGSELTLEQDLDLDLSDVQWNFDNQDDTDLTLISNEGSVTATTAAGDNAADEWDSIGAQAEQDITLEGDGSIKTTELDSTNGSIAVESFLNDVTANETVTAHNGSVSITADDDIKLKKKVTAGGDIILIADADGDKWIFGGDITAYDELETKAGSGGSIVVEASDTILLKDNVTADGSMTLTADSDDKWGGDMTAKGNLNAGDNIEISASNWTINLYGDVDAGGDVTLNTNTRFKGSGDQHVDAGGMITADGWLDKSPGFFSHSHGSLYLHADGDISLDDYVRAARFSLFCKYKGGGVSIISDNGSIFTPDEEGYPTDTLNVPITGRSDHFAGDDGIGVDLPFGEDLGKAAIVIQSSDDLLLGPKADLIARGKYYDDGVDDREGVDFLDVLGGADIGGVTRDEGDPFDAAIYVGSTAGNVDIGAEVTIKSSEWPGRCWGHYEFVPKGAMVADAYDRVTFGDLFEDSLADGDVGDRLEVVSRITEWLFQAVGRLPYPYGGGPFPPDYTYVLRGAGLDNPAITDGRAWVLEDPMPVPPLYEEAGQTLEPLTLGLAGCPVLVAAVSAELGVPGGTIEVSLANSFALNTNIQPCESCARLLNAATILRDEDGW